MLEKKENLDTKLMWIKRVNSLLMADSQLIKSIRIEKFCLMTTILSFSILIFSIYHLSFLEHDFFVFLASTAGLSLFFYPICLILVFINKKHRHKISSLFHKENYEVDIKDNKAELIDKSNNSIVLEVVIHNN